MPRAPRPPEAQSQLQLAGLLHFSLPSAGRGDEVQEGAQGRVSFDKRSPDLSLVLSDSGLDARARFSPLGFLVSLGSCLSALSTHELLPLVLIGQRAALWPVALGVQLLPRPAGGTFRLDCCNCILMSTTCFPSRLCVPQDAAMPPAG